MKVIRGNLWDYHKEGKWIGITTNGTIKNNGDLVMGKGIALQAAKKFPKLPTMLAQHVNMNQNTPCAFPEWKLFSFPTKNNFFEPADLLLIEQSCQLIRDYFELHYYMNDIDQLYLPKVGCGAGELSWPQVEPIVHAYLEDLVTIVDIA